MGRRRCWEPSACGAARRPLCVEALGGSGGGERGGERDGEVGERLPPVRGGERLDSEPRCAAWRRALSERAATRW